MVYSCDECDKTFARRFNLHRHVDTVHRMVPTPYGGYSYDGFAHASGSSTNNKRGSELAESQCKRFKNRDPTEDEDEDDEDEEEEESDEEDEEDEEDDENEEDEEGEDIILRHKTLSDLESRLTWAKSEAQSLSRANIRKFVKHREGIIEDSVRDRESDYEEDDESNEDADTYSDPDAADYEEEELDGDEITTLKVIVRMAKNRKFLLTFQMLNDILDNMYDRDIWNEDEKGIKIKRVIEPY